MSLKNVTIAVSLVLWFLAICWIGSGTNFSHMERKMAEAEATWETSAMRP